MKISEIIDKLEAYHGPLEPERRTCDIVQYGDPDQVCTGIVLSCCPTAEVIRKAAELGCNLIIGHEPLFAAGTQDKVRVLLSGGIHGIAHHLLVDVLGADLACHSLCGQLLRRPHDLRAAADCSGAAVPFGIMLNSATEAKV